MDEYSLAIMDSEKLIASVRKRPILYQSTKKTYKDSAKKEAQWQDIGRRIRRRCYGCV